jgi:hypothetical protein
MIKNSSKVKKDHQGTEFSVHLLGICNPADVYKAWTDTISSNNPLLFLVVSVILLTVYSQTTKLHRHFTYIREMKIGP